MRFLFWILDNGEWQIWLVTSDSVRGVVVVAVVVVVTVVFGIDVLPVTFERFAVSLDDDANALQSFSNASASFFVFST